MTNRANENLYLTLPSFVETVPVATRPLVNKLQNIFSILLQHCLTRPAEAIKMAKVIGIVALTAVVALSYAVSFLK